MAAEARTVSVVLDAKRILNANDRLDRHTRARRSSEIRAAFKHASIDLAHLTTPVCVDVQLTFPRRDRRRDSPNWMPTAKAALDGIVDSHVITDDSDNHVPRTTVLAHLIDPALRADPAEGLATRVRLTITLTETS